MDGHFVYSCGSHGAGWIAKDLVNLDPHRPLRLGKLLARACDILTPRPELVCGPAIGGLICAQVTALALNLPFVFAERAWHDGQQAFELHRGFDEFVKDERVLVVDDVINTGFSIDLTIDSVRAAGGTINAAAAWINRGNVYAEELGVEAFIYLDEIELPSWPAETCPLCQTGVPVNTRYAHGAEFMAAQR
jgi:orotate phosphoribosyltransferase